MSEVYGRENLRIPDFDIKLVGQNLGQYVEGYRTIIKKPSIGWLLAAVIMLGLSALFIMSDIMSLKIVSGFFILFSILILPVYFSDLYSYNKSDREFIQIHTNGFVWETFSWDGRSQSCNIICFDDVREINLIYSGHNINRKVAIEDNISNRSLELSVAGLYGQIICEKKLPRHNIRTLRRDYNSAVVLGYVAIMDRWTEIAVKRYKQEEAEKGYFICGNMKVGRNYLVVNEAADSKNHAEGARDFIFTGSYLIFYPKDIQASPYYHPIKNPTGSYAVDIAYIPNKDAFERIFREFWVIQ